MAVGRLMFKVGVGRSVVGTGSRRSGRRGCDGSESGRECSSLV